MLLALLLACTVDPAAPKVADSAAEDSAAVEDPCAGDADCDGWTVEEGDCSESPDVHPDAEEVCNGLDDDCDGEADEDLLVGSWADEDGDGWGDPARYALECEATGVSRAGDCDDADGAVHPEAAEACNGVDDDCDDDVDEGLAATGYADDDGDGAGDPTRPLEGCDGSGVATGDDCDDTDPSVQACRSCQEVLDRGLGTADGVYSLDPCGGAPSDFWCDQTTDGGGWTLAGWQAADATTTLGLSVRNSPGDPDFSVDLTCLGFDEIAVFDRTHGLWEAQRYDGQVWAETAINLHIGDPGTAFGLGTYGPAGIVMGCVDYAYDGAVVTAYACDSDWAWGPRGHMTDYAGEYCGARLDYTWAWVDGTSCSYTGVPYTWGYMLRGEAVVGGNGNG